MRVDLSRCDFDASIFCVIDSAVPLEVNSSIPKSQPSKVVTGHEIVLTLPFSVPPYPYPDVTWVTPRGDVVVASDRFSIISNTDFARLIVKQATFNDTGFYTLMIGPSNARLTYTFNVTVAAGKTLISSMTIHVPLTI